MYTLEHRDTRNIQNKDIVTGGARGVESNKNNMYVNNAKLTTP